MSAGTRPRYGRSHSQLVTFKECTTPDVADLRNVQRPGRTTLQVRSMGLRLRLAFLITSRYAPALDAASSRSTDKRSSFQTRLELPVDPRPSSVLHIIAPISQFLQVSRAGTTDPRPPSSSWPTGVTTC